MDTVSVVLPTYDRGEFIDGAIQSVLEQTYENIECIVVADKPTEAVREYLESITDERVRVLIHEEKQGLSKARNVGIEAATGKYVCFLDDDDRLYEDAVQTLVEEIQAQPADCAGVFPAGKEIGRERRYTVPENQVTLENYEQRPWIPPTGMLLKKSIFNQAGTFDESFPTVEDTDLWLRIVAVSFLVGVPQILYEKHYHEAQLTKNHVLMLRGYQRLLEKHGHRLSDSYLSLLHRQIAIRYGEIGNVAAARKHLKTACKYNLFDKANLFYRVWLLFGTTGFRIGRTIHTQIYDKLRFREHVGGAETSTAPAEYEQTK